MQRDACAPARVSASRMQLQTAWNGALEWRPKKCSNRTSSGGAVWPVCGAYAGGNFGLVPGHARQLSLAQSQHATGRACPTSLICQAKYHAFTGASIHRKRALSWRASGHPCLTSSTRPHIPLQVMALGYNSS